MKSSIPSARVLGSISLLAALGACDARGSGNTGPIDSDGGASDTGAPTDATLPPADIGTPPVDVGTPPVDVGTPPVDVGTPPVDVGTPPVDVGTPPVDVGTPPVDVGTPPVDVGTPPVDAGGFARYRRTVTDATLVEACTLPGAQRVLVNADDESTTLIAPFSMRFFGIPVPQSLGLQVYSNGFISQMAIDPTMAIGGTIPDSRPPNGLIAPYWADLVTGTDGVCSVVVGSAPIRRWIIQWKNARFYTGETSMPVAGTASFEVIYNEADASMDFIYETITGQPMNAPTRAAVGLEHPDGSLAFVVCPGGRIDATPRAPDCTSVTTGTRFRVVPTGD